MRLRTFVLLLLALAPLAAPAPGATDEAQLEVSIGWNGPYRPGRWSPVFVTASNAKPRQVVLEAYVPTDDNYAMKVVQKFAIGPTPATYPLYLPLQYNLGEASITLIADNSLKRIAYTSLEWHNPQPVRPDQFFVGITGSQGSERLLQEQFRQDNVVPGFLSQSFLPRVAAGLEGLDLLVLNSPNFSRLDADQQHAIVQWVRSGGSLLVIPGTDPMPETGPLLEVLPVKLGETRNYEIPKASLASAGLAERFASLKGRAVAAVAEGATTKAHLAIPTFRQWLGFGQVLVIPADLSALVFNTPDQSRAFWTKVLEGMATLPPKTDANAANYYGNWQDDPRQHRATQQALDWISDVPGAGEFGFSYLALALIAMMVIVGPVDWFILKWLGRQPWTWVTTTGWIALVTLGAIYIGHVFKSGDLHLRSVTLMDESEGMRVAQTSIAGVYAPKTREYDLQFAPESWWKPASYGFRGGGQKALHRQIDCHQDYRGNRPLPILINVWNLRFLQGSDATPTGAMIAAKVSRTGDNLAGSITNHGSEPLTNIAIRTRDGPLRLQGKLEPGATMPVSGKIDRGDHALATYPLDAKSRNQFNPELPSTRPALPIAGELSAGRSDRIEQILRERSDIACVYATIDQPKASAAKLDEPEMHEAHIALVRALVPLENR